MDENANRSGNAIIYIIIIVVVLVVAAGSWYFIVYQPEQEAKERARLEQLALAEAEKKAAEQAAQDKINYDQLILNGDAAFQNEDWETARSLYTQALALFPDEQYPRDQLTLIVGKMDEIAVKMTGTFETVSSSTGRYYAIVSSSLDDDLAIDYANKLVQEGTAVKIVEHKANGKTFFGVSVADYPNWEEAYSALNSFNNYGEVWVLKW